MKTGSAVLGILGGAIALIIGVISFFVGNLGPELGIQGSVARLLLVLEIGVFSLITAIPIGIGALLAFVGSATTQKPTPA